MKDALKTKKFISWQSEEHSKEKQVEDVKEQLAKAKKHLHCKDHRQYKPVNLVAM